MSKSNHLRNSPNHPKQALHFLATHQDRKPTAVAVSDPLGIFAKSLSVLDRPDVLRELYKRTTLASDRPEEK